MANPIKGEVAFTVGGEPFTLVYSMDALVQLEDLTDLRFDEVASLVLKKRRLRMMRAMFWAGLIEHHPGVTVLSAGEMMKLPVMFEGGEGVFDLLTTGIARAFPKKSDAGEGDTGPQLDRPLEADPAAGISSTSSPSGASTSPAPSPTTGG